jgi:hypothetical protein
MKKIFRISLLTVFFSLAGLLYFFNPATSKLFPPCPFYTITGFYCPGCGSQRALHNILNMDPVSAVKNNFLVIPALLVIIYNLICEIIKPEQQNILYHKSAPWLVLCIINIFWVFRNIPAWPFNLLAPS